jgi:hypothetical protein
MAVHLLRRTARSRSPRPVAGFAAWTFLAIWLIGTGLAIGYFETRDVRPFSEGSPFLNLTDDPKTSAWFKSHLADSAAAGELTLVQLYNPNCRCDSYTESHLKKIAGRYRGRRLRLVAVAAGRDGIAHPLGLPIIFNATHSLPQSIKMAPAALIFDGSGRLLYYGPFSDSVWCSSSDGGLIETAIERAFRGEFTPTPMAIRGCFCPWQP